MSQRRMNEGVLEIIDEDNQIIMSLTEQMADDVMNISVSGTIKNDVAHEFEDELMAALSVCPHLRIDLQKTDYIASRALRSLLSVQQMMDTMEDADMILKISPAVKSTFEESGFLDILNIEE